MAPITVLDNEIIGLQDDLMSFRARWESVATDIDPKFMSLLDMDPKAVGGHLSLGKRSSHPIGVNYNHLKMAPSLQQHSPQMMVNIPPPTVEGTLSQQQHRRLDRSQSEPIRGQPSSPGAESSRTSSSSRYKTELCRPFGETGFCKYGEKCQFAHGFVEVRNMPRHPKYKTELCRTFHTTGLCGYGSRCHFIHNAEERRNPSTNQQCLFNSKEDGPLTPSPPASLSPTSQGGSFFNDNFILREEDDFVYPPPYVGPETPPISPVESLAGDMDNMSLSHSNMSTSPSPPNTVLLNAFKDNIRLPIFEALTEVP